MRWCRRSGGCCGGSGKGAGGGRSRGCHYRRPPFPVGHRSSLPPLPPTVVPVGRHSLPGCHCRRLPLPPAAIAAGCHCRRPPFPPAAIPAGRHSRRPPFPSAAIAAGRHSRRPPSPPAAIPVGHHYRRPSFPSAAIPYPAAIAAGRRSRRRPFPTLPSSPPRPVIPAKAGIQSRNGGDAVSVGDAAVAQFSRRGVYGHWRRGGLTPLCRHCGGLRRGRPRRPFPPRLTSFPSGFPLSRE